MVVVAVVLVLVAAGYVGRQLWTVKLATTTHPQ